MQGSRVEIVDFGVDSAAEKIRVDAACKNRILGIETRFNKRDEKWHTLPALLLVGLVVVTQRQRIAAAAV